MTAFVIHAAGRGSRIGRVGTKLHKGLVPLGGKAIISHVIDSAPYGARIIICVGYRGDQIKDYVSLAHPHLPVTYVVVNDWDKPGAGPGATLLAARKAVGSDDLVFTPCDTLWQRDAKIWRHDYSWIGVAPIPEGTKPERWCRIYANGNDGDVMDILDKRIDPQEGLRLFTQWAFTGLAHIAADDLELFWDGVETGGLVENERQISGGFHVLRGMRRYLKVMPIEWTDVGDEQSYHDAIVRQDGIDWAKDEQATYVLPDVGRVIKWYAKGRTLENAKERAEMLNMCVPTDLSEPDHPSMMAYQFVPGTTAYRAIEMRRDDVVATILMWWNDVIWSRRIPREFTPDEGKRKTHDFYFGKTMKRVEKLSPELRRIAMQALNSINWLAIADSAIVGPAHGDFNFGNIIIPTGFTEAPFGIDWRPDFGDDLPWGDLRYDLAKLMAGCKVHWERVRHGDLTPWVDAEEYLDMIRQYCVAARICMKEVEIIGAVSLINCAPLHPEPLTTHLVTVARDWLEEIHK